MFRVVSPHPLSGAHVTVSTVSGISKTVTADFSERDWTVTGVRPVVLLPDDVETVTCAPDDGWRYHPKHVEQFTDINKLYIVASLWIIIGLHCRFIVYVNLVRFTRRRMFLCLRESSWQAIVLSERCVSCCGIRASRVDVTFAGLITLWQAICKAIIKQTLLSHNSRPRLRQSNLLLSALSSHLWPVVKGKSRHRRQGLSCGFVRSETCFRTCIKCNFLFTFFSLYF
jgi:hypothetical protein